MSKDGPIYKKFTVLRIDGASEPGGKHYGCDYFVLDITHDPYAADALIAYSEACRVTHPELSENIKKKIGGGTDAP